MRNIVMLDENTLFQFARAAQHCAKEGRTFRVCTDTNAQGETFIQWKTGEGMWTAPHYSEEPPEAMRHALNSREPMFEAIGEKMVVVTVP